MPVKPLGLWAVVCAFFVTAILLLSSAPMGPILVPQRFTESSEVPGQELQLPEALSNPDELPGLVEPGDPVPAAPAGDPPPEREELCRLAQLEGKYLFENVRPSYYRDHSYYMDLCCDAVGLYSVDANADGIRLGSQPERTVEEADVVKVDGDRLYVLNPYKGFMVFDLSDPLHPAYLGRAPILGDPFEMYVVGTKAYVIVTASYGWWYYGMWRNSYSIQPVLYDGIDADESFYIGSKVLVVDLADESDPRVVARFGLEGDVTDSRRVGDVIYFVSNVYSWYKSMDGDYANEDLTSVMALNMADPRAPRVEDRVTFPSATNVIHVSQQYVFVAQKQTFAGDREEYSRVTIVDIRDPLGKMAVRGSYKLNGRVSDRYQLDQYEDMLRVVSFINTNRGSSRLTVLDIGDPDSPAMLGSLDIADAGDLMATRFAGERAYTIHLPRPVRIDPLDVIDLSDPCRPRLCDVLEIPGWVTHIEVRGLRLLALGVDSTSRPQGVSMSLFDVTDPDEAVLLSRVAIGEGSAWSTANNDPKALTVLDERGLVLVPFASSSVTRTGSRTTLSGVQVVEFDLGAGSLRLAGCFEQPDNVLRTRAVGSAIVSTSKSFLLAVDLSDVDAPVVTSTIDFRIQVLDYYIHDARAAAIVRTGYSGELELRLLRESDTEAMCPIAQERLPRSYCSWGWQGDGLMVLYTDYSSGKSWTVLQAYDLSSGDGIRKVGSCVLPTYYNVRYGPWTRAGMESSYAASWEAYGGYVDEVVLQLGGVVVLKDENRLAILDVRDIDYPCLRCEYELDDLYFVDVRAYGERLYITYREQVTSDQDEDIWSLPYQSGDASERFYLLTLDISDLVAPRASYPINIPGIPVGVSDGGRTVYTVAYWKLSNDGPYTKTLNVVHLLGMVAFQTRAYLINMSSMVTMDGDRAYVLTPGTSSYNTYRYGDVYLGIDYFDYYMPPTRTYASDGPSELWVVDLGRDGPRGVVAHTVVGESCSAMYAIGGSLVLDLGTQEGLLVMRMGPTDGMRIVGSYETTGTVNSLRCYEGKCYLSQGEFGITTIELI